MPNKKSSYIEITNGLGLELIQHSGSDNMVADAARVSTDRDRQGRQIQGLIEYLARERHMSPFEHCHITFMIKAPLFVRDQWVRHRTQSYNSLSLRYTKLPGGEEDSINLEDIFYYPPPNRPLENEGSASYPIFKQEPGLDEYSSVIKRLNKAYKTAYYSYLELLEVGVASEVARSVLPEGTLTRFYATANLRNWEAFVKERTEVNAQWEIKQLAKAIDGCLSGLYPISWGALRRE